MISFHQIIYVFVIKVFFVISIAASLLMDRQLVQVLWVLRLVLLMLRFQ